MASALSDPSVQTLRFDVFLPFHADAEVGIIINTRLKHVGRDPEDVKDLRSG